MLTLLLKFVPVIKFQCIFFIELNLYLVIFVFHRMLSLNITTTRWPIRNLLRIALTRNGKTYDIFVV